MAERRTWLWVVLGIGAIAIVAVVTFVSLIALMVTRSTKVTTAAQAEASDQFETIRSQFRHEVPLLKMSGNTVDDSELTRRSATRGAQRARTLQVLAWNHADQKLVKLSLPIWMLRFSTSGNFRIGSAGVSFERVRLDPATVARIGPALVLDARLDEVDVLLWTE